MPGRPTGLDGAEEPNSVGPLAGGLPGHGPFVVLTGAVAHTGAGSLLSSSGCVAAGQRGPVLGSLAQTNCSVAVRVRP